MIEPITKKLEKKIEKGDSLSNDELISAIKYYKEIVRLTAGSSLLGVVTSAVIHKLSSLEAYASNRGIEL